MPQHRRRPRRVARAARVLLTTLSVVGVAAATLLAGAAPAVADPQVPFVQDVYARTHLAKSGIDVTVPPGTFTGTIDLATGEETGTLDLPPATITMNLFGLLPVADATFVMAPTGPVRGHVDLETFTVDSSASFNVRLARLTPHGTDVNLVGDTCRTATPITVAMHGVVNPATGGTFASTYTIPKFEGCGALTSAITAFVSGPGNTFVSSFAPHGSPPPAAPASDPPAPAASAHVDASVSVETPGVPPTTVEISRELTLPAAPPMVTATPASSSPSPLPPLPLPMPGLLP